jgi:hypothetical protein
VKAQMGRGFESDQGNLVGKSGRPRAGALAGKLGRVP